MSSMITNIENAGLLLALSKSGPLFRTVFLPSADPQACVQFYSAHGFLPTTTQVLGRSMEYVTVKNPWHTIVFVKTEGSGIRAPQSLDGPVKLAPHFLSSVAMNNAVSARADGFAIESLIDPDGRHVAFAKYIGSCPEPRNTGLMCWIDVVDAFRHWFIRIETANSRPNVTSLVMPKQSAFMIWNEEGFLCGQPMAIPQVEMQEIKELSTEIQADMNRLGVDVGEDELLTNTHFYRLLLVGDGGAEVSTTLSKLEPLLANLSSAIRNLFIPVMS